ncbi:MAG: hypothetical protein ACM3YE_03000, partial [Bacteroidota bacterium]
VMDWSPNRLSRIPPFCFWFGSRLYYEKLPFESDTHIRFIQQLYFIIAILIPGLIVMALFILIFYIGNHYKDLRDPEEIRAI